jgi:hypothetical protein
VAILERSTDPADLATAASLRAEHGKRLKQAHDARGIAGRFVRNGRPFEEFLVACGRFSLLRREDVEAIWNEATNRSPDKEGTEDA